MTFIDLVLIASLLGIGIGLVWGALSVVKWKCIFGKHDYVYNGRCSGMTINPDGRGITYTVRTMYKCSHCGKSKPIESVDYV